MMIGPRESAWTRRIAAGVRPCQARVKYGNTGAQVRVAVRLSGRFTCAGNLDLIGASSRILRCGDSEDLVSGGALFGNDELVPEDAELLLRQAVSGHEVANGGANGESEGPPPVIVIAGDEAAAPDLAKG